MVTEHNADRWRVRAVRGATTVDRDDPERMYEATRELLCAILDRNGLSAADIVSAIFTVTPDLNCAFPARAARDLGWTEVPMLCATEIAVPDSPSRCVRVLLHVERPDLAPRPLHVYLRGAATLRPDLAANAAPLAP